MGQSPAVHTDSDEEEHELLMQHPSVVPQEPDMQIIDKSSTLGMLEKIEQQQNMTSNDTKRSSHSLNPITSMNQNTEISQSASEIDVDKVYDFHKKEDDIIQRTTTEEAYNFQDSYKDELAPLNETNNAQQTEESEIEETNMSTTGLAKVQRIRSNFAATIDQKMASSAISQPNGPSMPLPDTTITTQKSNQSSEIIEMESDNPIPDEDDISTQQQQESETFDDNKTESPIPTSIETEEVMIESRPRGKTYEIEQVYNQVMDEKEEETHSAIQPSIEFIQATHEYVPSTSTPLPDMDQNDDDDENEDNKVVQFDMLPVAEDEEVDINIQNEETEPITMHKMEKSKSGKTVRRSFTQNRSSSSKNIHESPIKSTKQIRNRSKSNTKERDLKSIREERRKKMRKSRAKQKRKNKRKKEKAKMKKATHRQASTMMPTVRSSMKAKNKQKKKSKDDSNVKKKNKKKAVAKQKRERQKARKKKEKERLAAEYKQAKAARDKKNKSKTKSKEKKPKTKNKKDKKVSIQEDASKTKKKVERKRKVSKRMTAIMKAQKALEKTRQTMADSKKEERASLKAASSKKNSAHMKMLGNVTISDNILKALKSLPASSRRGLENEIRMQLMNEQKELQQLTQQLSQNHLTIAKQQQMLAASKEEYEKKAKKADKMKENLESERRAMQQQIDSIAT